MENKKTSELLDLLWTIEQSDKDEDWDNYTEAYDELLKRTPYNKILGEGPANELTLEESIIGNIADIKLLKRHKHDVKNGDVLIRI